jgi:hypothetical protein
VDNPWDRSPVQVAGQSSATIGSVLNHRVVNGSLNPGTSEGPGTLSLAGITSGTPSLEHPCTSMGTLRLVIPHLLLSHKQGQASTLSKKPW